MHDDNCGFSLVAVKRPIIPETLFAMFKWVIPYQPFRWIFTTEIKHYNESGAYPQKESRMIAVYYSKSSKYDEHPMYVLTVKNDTVESFLAALNEPEHPFPESEVVFLRDGVEVNRYNLK